MWPLPESDRESTEAARIAAELATLPNLRARGKTVAEVWAKMADQLERLERMQQAREAF